MLSVLAMRRPEDEELGGRGDGAGDEFVDISHMQLLVEAGPSGLHYPGPQPPLAQHQPYAQPPAPPAPLAGTSHAAAGASASASVDDLFALYFTPTTHGKHRYHKTGNTDPTTCQTKPMNCTTPCRNLLSLATHNRGRS